MLTKTFEVVQDVKVLKCGEVLLNRHLYTKQVVSEALQHSHEVFAYLNVDGFLPVERKSFRPTPSDRSIFGKMINFRFDEQEYLVADIQLMNNFAGKYFQLYNHDGRLKFILSSRVRYDSHCELQVKKISHMDEVSVLAIRNDFAIPDLVLQDS